MTDTKWKTVLNSTDLYSEAGAGGSETAWPLALALKDVIVVRGPSLSTVSKHIKGSFRPVILSARKTDHLIRATYYLLEIEEQKGNESRALQIVNPSYMKRKHPLIEFHSQEPKQALLLDPTAQL